MESFMSLKRKPSFLDDNSSDTSTDSQPISKKIMRIDSISKNIYQDVRESKRAKIVSSESDETDSIGSSMAGLFDQYFSSTDEENDPIISDNEEKYLLGDFDLTSTEQPTTLNLNNFEIQKSLKCPNHHGKISIPWDIDVKVISKLDDILAIRHDRMLITAASYPFHIEWCNSGFSQVSGWSAEEVLGLNCSFMQGSGTDRRVIGAFMEMLEMSGGFADMTIINYSKYNTVLRNTIHCFPISDNCGFSDATNVTHIGVVLLESQEITSPSVQDDFLKTNLQFDRREQSLKYPYINCTPPPVPSEWMNLAKDFTISLMLRFMMRSEGAIMLTDSDGKIVHTNIAWTELTNFRFCEVESVSVFDILGKKSKSSDVSKLISLYESNEISLNEFKKPYSAKYMCQLELYIKRRYDAPPNAFQNYVRKTPAQLALDEDPCAFCQIYDENSEMMKTIMDTIPIHASVVRFNSEHIAYLFTKWNGLD